jgi:hypothetical protein
VGRQLGQPRVADRCVLTLVETLHTPYCRSLGSFAAGSRLSVSSSGGCTPVKSALWQPDTLLSTP